MARPAGCGTARSPRSPTDYRVILWDMRGHGRSGDPADPARLFAGADASATWRRCSMPAASSARSIGGLSLGGVMSLAFHIAYPERVRALMLFDTGPGFRNPERPAAVERARRGARPRPRGQRARRLRRRRRDAARHASLGARLGGRGARHAGAIRREPDRIPADDPRFRRWCWSAARTRTSSPPPITWPRRSPAPARSVIPAAGHAANLDQPDSIQPRGRGLSCRPASVGERPRPCSPANASIPALFLE